MTDTKPEETPAAQGAESRSIPQPDVTASDQKLQTAAPKTDEASATEATTAPAPGSNDPKKQRRISRKPVPPPVPGTYPEVDQSKPQDFEGEVLTTNELPSPEILKKIDDYIVLDRDGKSHTFKTLYSGTNVARRVLMIFIRHFFCGNCQDYLRELSQSISPESLLALPVSTFIVIIGCGDPALIESYAQDTGCQFQIYTDPKRSLFDALGMNQTLALGEKPAYMKKPMYYSVLSSIINNVRAVPSGLALKGGNQRQVGGEFLFEPSDLVTPVSSPKEEKRMYIGIPEKTQAEHRNDAESEGHVEEKRVTWCHRMKTTRDHCEIPELMEILGLDGQGHPIKDQARWQRALMERKGVGSSMAAAMSELSLERDREKSAAV